MLSVAVNIFSGDEDSSVPCEGQSRSGADCFMNAQGSLDVLL